MTLKEYSKEARFNGFIGIRVSGYIGDRRLEQYFSFRKIPGACYKVAVFYNKKEIAAIRKKAAKLDAQWKEEGVLFRIKRDQAAKFPKHSRTQYHTGICGLTCAFRHDRNNNLFMSIRYRSLEFPDKPMRNKTVSNVKNLKEVWKFCTKELATFKGYDKPPAKWKKVMPNLEQLKEMQVNYVKNNKVNIRDGWEL